MYLTERKKKLLFAGIMTLVCLVVLGVEAVRLVRSAPQQLFSRNDSYSLVLCDGGSCLRGVHVTLEPGRKGQPSVLLSPLSEQQLSVIPAIATFLEEQPQGIFRLDHQLACTDKMLASNRPPERWEFKKVPLPVTALPCCPCSGARAGEGLLTINEEDGCPFWLQRLAEAPNRFDYYGQLAIVYASGLRSRWLT